MTTLGTRIRIRSFAALALCLGLVTPTLAVSPTLAAEQLLDHGEAKYPALFAGHPVTQEYGPFRYRAYTNGLLLGVVVSANPNYVLNGVYVMGGTFGNSPLYLGQMMDFITPTGTNNGCTDLSLLDTPDTRIVIAYRRSGTIITAETQDTLVSNATTFAGQQAFERTTTNSGTRMVDGVPVPFESEIKSYGKRTGEGESSLYGDIFISRSSTTLKGTTTTTTTELKSVFDPARVDRRFTLAPGDSIMESGGPFTTVMTTTSSIEQPGLPPQISTSTSTINNSLLPRAVKFVGREVLTVAAGTYNTCKFEYSAPGEPDSGSTTSWIIVGKGLTAKSISMHSQGTEIIEATSMKLNGQNL